MKKYRFSAVVVCTAAFCAAAPVQAIAQPAITATVTPAPNAAGWNNTAITVSYACTRAVVCPEPVSVTTEGKQLLVRRTVADAEGRAASISTVVNIDFAPARIRLISPAQDTSEAAVTAVSAEAVDTLSGVASATCNGDSARLENGRIQCAVRLRDALNDIVVQVTDRAGNSSAAGRQVQRIGAVSAITVIPAGRTLAVGESVALQAVDNFGRPLTDVTWTTDVSGVLELADDQRLTARAIGTAGVTASWEQLSAAARVRVLPSKPFPLGTTLWTIRPLPGFQSSRQDSPSFHLSDMGQGPPTALYVEDETAGSAIMLRAIDRDGRQLWVEAPAVSLRERFGDQLAGDEMGARLVRVDSADGTSSIVRVGRSPMGGVWRYTAPGRLGREFATYGGIVDVVETDAAGFPSLVGIDGMTGSATFRVPLPRSSYTARNVRCIAGADARIDRPAAAGLSPTVLNGGTVTLAISTVDEIEDFLPCGKGTTVRRRKIQLVEVRDEEVTYRTVFEYPPTAGDVAVDLEKVLPDGHDGHLVKWTARTASQPPDHVVVRVTEGQLIVFRLPAIGPMVLAEADLGVTTDGRTLVGFDVLTGKVLWTHHATGPVGFLIKMSVAGGGVVVGTDRGIEHFAYDGRRTNVSGPAKR